MNIKKQEILSRLSLVVLLTLSAIIVGALLIYNSYSLLREQQAAVAHARSVTRELDSLLASTVDAETGIRGYLLVGKLEYLEPYHRGKENVWLHLARLKELSTGSSEQELQIRRLEKTIQARMDLLAKYVIPGPWKSSRSLLIQR